MEIDKAPNILTKKQFFFLDLRTKYFISGYKNQEYFIHKKFFELVRMPVLLKCCFCAKLELGGYIIGGLAVLYSILFIIASIVIVGASKSEDKIHIGLRRSNNI